MFLPVYAKTAKECTFIEEFFKEDISLSSFWNLVADDDLFYSN